MGRRAASALTLALIATALTASGASGAATRAEYVTQAEAVCATAEDEARDLFRKAKKTAGKLEGGSKKGRAGKRQERKEARAFAKLLLQSNGITERMIEAVAAIPPAPGDEVQVGQWIFGLREYAEIVDDSARAMRKFKILKAFGLFFASYDRLVKAAEWVEGYGFTKCPGGEVITNEVFRAPAGP